MRASYHLPIALFALILLPAAAAAQVSFSGVDGITSTVMQHGQSSFSGIGARARLVTMKTAKDFEVCPEIEFWRTTSTLQIYDIHSVRRDATLGAVARYRFPAKTWRPYVGGGFSIHFISNEVKAPALGIPDADHSIMKGALSALAGVSFPLEGPFETFLEAKYHHVTDYEQLKLNWGLSYNAH